MRPIDELRTRYYMRMTVADRPGVLARIAAVLGDNQISIATFIQKEANEADQTAEIVIMTHEAQEQAVQKRCAGGGARCRRQIGSFIRIEE